MKKENKKIISNNGVSILSLFDGMACGALAFKSAGITVKNYSAYEIDKYAIKTVTHNFPDIQECGDVFEADFTKYKDIDYLIGGSPCTYWSIAQSPDKRETTASGIGWELFTQYVRALNEVKPKYFIYENNKSMAKAIYNSISKTFGFEPIMINSALVSAQNRQRYYWVGKRNLDGTYSKVDIKQPEDKGILLKDVLDGYDLIGRNKSFTYTTRCQAAIPEDTITRNRHTMVVEPVNTSTYGASGVAEPVCMRYERSETAKKLRKGYESGNVKHGYHEYSELHPRPDGKTNTLSTVLKDNPILEPVIVGAAQRGRYKNGLSTEQHFEIREDEKSNCLTTVQKDSLVCQQIGALPRPNGELSKSQAFRIYDVNKKSVTLKAGGGGAGGKTGLYAIPIEFDGDKPIKAISFADGKTYKVYEVKNGMITIKEKTYPIKLVDGYYIIRKLTVSECKRLQTVPEWYEFPVSDSQAYKMLGNGWTVEVIAHNKLGQAVNPILLEKKYVSYN